MFVVRCSLFVVRRSSFVVLLFVLFLKLVCLLIWENGFGCERKQPLKKNQSWRGVGGEGAAPPPQMHRAFSLFVVRCSLFVVRCRCRCRCCCCCCCGCVFVVRVVLETGVLIWEWFWL